MSSNTPVAQPGNEWKAGLFGCFSDTRLCLVTFFVPCYTAGKNAEGIGEDCLLHGLLSMLYLNFGPLVRWRLRQQRQIGGTMLMDVLVHTVCPCCAMVQEARELGYSTTQPLNDVGRRPYEQQDMSRE